MISDCIERLGHKKQKTKTRTKTKQNKKSNNKKAKKNQGKNKQIKNGNNGTHHELLSEEWVGGRS